MGEVLRELYTKKARAERHEEDLQIKTWLGINMIDKTITQEYRKQPSSKFFLASPRNLATDSNAEHLSLAVTCAASISTSGGSTYDINS